MSFLKSDFFKTPIILLVVGLLVGVGGGYFLVSGMYQPRITKYEEEIEGYFEQVNSLTDSLGQLVDEKSGWEAQISTLSNENSELQAEKSQLESDLDQAEETVSLYETEISDLEEQLSTLLLNSSQQSGDISSLLTEIDDLESELKSIYDLNVNHKYPWDYGVGYYPDEYEWELTFPLREYFYYYFKSRPSSWRDYINMVDDPGDDDYISYIVQKIEEVAVKEEYSVSGKINFAVGFVQKLPYTEKIVTRDWDEHPKYPLETLFDRGGDCEDTSILTAALLDKMGHDVCLVFPVDEEHCSVGVALDGDFGYFYNFDGKKYFNLETTGGVWRLGQIPASYDGLAAYVYPLNP